MSRFEDQDKGGKGGKKGKSGLESGHFVEVNRNGKEGSSKGYGKKGKGKGGGGEGNWWKGKGKSKGGRKSATKSEFSPVPAPLKGGQAKNAEGEPFCFGFNMGTCDACKPGERCAKGWHRCMKK